MLFKLLFVWKAGSVENYPPFNFTCQSLEVESVALEVATLAKTSIHNGNADTILHT
jgi:hypothetical protein